MVGGSWNQLGKHQKAAAQPRARATTQGNVIQTCCVFYECLYNNCQILK